ncbi:MAG: S8 family serine peptidase, partial [bacterium]
GAALGIASVSWNARLMPIKVLDENGLGTVADSAAGIQHAVQTWQAARGNQPAPPFPVGAENSIFNEPFNARLVINMSYSIEIPDALGEPQLEKDAIAYAVSNGAVLVAAAGDQGKPVDDGFTTSYPAGHSSVIAVGAVDEINQVTVPSNKPKTTVPLADQRFVVAPGVNVLGTLPQSLGSYGVGQGTSVAAAQVSGLCALMWSYFPQLLNEDGLVPTLLETCNADIVGEPGVDATSGYGLINGLDALNGVFEPRPTNDPLIVRAFTDPVVHNVIHFVVLSKYRLMDVAEIPFFLDDTGQPVLINNGAAFSYQIGIDANGDGTLQNGELLPIDTNFFPNEVVVAQFDDTTYLGRVFFVQGPPPAPGCPAGTLLPPPPPTGDLIISVTGVPEDFLIDETLPKTISASTTIQLTDFSNS